MGDTQDVRKVGRRGSDERGGEEWKAWAGREERMEKGCGDEKGRKG